MTMHYIVLLIRSEKRVPVITCKVRRAFSLKGYFNNIIKVKKKAKIKNQYNQVPHLTKDSIWKVTKTQEHISFSLILLWGKVVQRVVKSYVDNLVALISLALSLSNIKSDFLRTKKDFTGSFIFFFALLNYMFYDSGNKRRLQFRKFCRRTRTRIGNKSSFIGFFIEFG